MQRVSAQRVLARRVPARRAALAWLDERLRLAAGRGARSGRSRVALALGVLMAAGLVSTSAFADPLPASSRPYSQGRYYLGAEGAVAIPTGSLDNLDPSPGIRVRGGMRFHPRWSADLQGDWYQRFDGSGEHATAWAISANGRFHLATGRTQPFLTVGAGVFQSNEMGDGNANRSFGFAPRAGVGVLQYLTGDIALTLDATYVSPVGGPRDLEFFAVGLGILWH